MTKEKKEKKTYIIQVEGYFPAVAKFRVQADDEEDAYRIFDKYPNKVQVQDPPKVKDGKIIRKKISIKEALSNMIKFVKTF